MRLIKNTTSLNNQTYRNFLLDAKLCVFILGDQEPTDACTVLNQAEDRYAHKKTSSEAYRPLA